MLYPLRPLFLYCQWKRNGLQSLSLYFDGVLVYKKRSLRPLGGRTLFIDPYDQILNLYNIGNEAYIVGQ